MLPRSSRIWMTKCQRPCLQLRMKSGGKNASQSNTNTSTSESRSTSDSSDNPRQQPGQQPQQQPQQQQKSTKSVTQTDDELRERLEQMSGEGGASGIEYEDGQPNTMKRSVRNNMFRYI